MSGRLSSRQNQGTDEAVLQGVSDARRWTLVALLCLAAIINFLDRATISVALPRIAQEFSLGPTAKGLVLSSFFWFYTLLQVPVGVLVDRLNVRWLYAGAFALWSVACGLTGMVGGFATLIVMRIILGIGEAVMLPGSLRVVNIIFPPRDRGLPTGIVTSGTRLGLALGTPLVAWLTVRYGWRTMFAVVGFSALIWLLPWIMTFPGPSSARSEETTSQNDPAGKPRGWLFTIDRNLIGSCLGYFSFGYYQYMLMTWLPDYFVHVRHFQLLKAGVYAAASYLIWGFGQAAGGWLGDAMVGWGWSETTVRKGLISASYVSGLLLIPAVLVSNPQVAMLLVAGSSLVGVSSSNILVIMQNCAPHGEVGSWIGFGNFVGNLGGVLSPFVTGVLISWTGSYFPGFALAPLVLVVGILPFWFIVQDLDSGKR